MDLREKKTKRSIRNAFLQLRAHKPLERISVKELAELAEISKATFYLHYHDIYELSEYLQQEVIKDIVTDISKPDLFLYDIQKFHTDLIESFYSHQLLIDILFSGSQASMLPINIEKILKEHIFELLPEKRDDVRFNILLSYTIQGGFFAYNENAKTFGGEKVQETIKEIVRLLYPTE